VGHALLAEKPMGKGGQIPHQYFHRLAKIDPPRERDKWLMRAFIKAGITRDDKLLILNRVCCHQQALFLSDVLNAGGKNIDSRYLNRRPHDEAWSLLVFPREKPPNRHVTM
jgi:hypothetical protein